MAEPRSRSGLSLFWRSFAIQGSWNYETLIGTGFAFLLIPILRTAFGGDEQRLRAALRRQAELFNCHPYFAGLAAGAVARLEIDGAEPKLITRFKDALRGSLGAIGDQLFWSSWRPASALLGVMLLLLGAPWWLAVGGFLVVYNALHLYVRIWGARVGFRDGLGVAKRIRDAPFSLLGRRAADAGALLAGISFALAITAVPGGKGDAAIAAAAATLGFWLGPRVRRVLLAAFALLWIIGMGLGLAAS